VTYHRASVNDTGRFGGRRMYGESVFRQQLEPLPFRQVARRDDLEVPAVKGSDLVQVESLG
jgi:hypothetical protein